MSYKTPSRAIFAERDLHLFVGSQVGIAHAIQTKEPSPLGRGHTAAELMGGM